MKSTYNEFVIKLKKLYGNFDEEQKKFEKAPNSKISRELGYSDAQFSRLINESATEGEYARANQNADRILMLLKLEEEIKTVRSGKLKRRYIAVGIVLILISAFIGYFINQKIHDENNFSLSSSRYEMLKWSFETEYVNPYTKLINLPSDCNFACYKYQGKWELGESYKIPFFRERSGFHYAATEVIMYARCMPEKSPTGDFLEGYEYQKHEIWYDTSESPIDSFLSANGTELTEEYKKMDLSKQKNFIKVAYVHTFFRNEFQIDTTQILRTGKVIGRDIEFVSNEELEAQLGSSEMVDEISKEVQKIITNRLEDFSRPISCGEAITPHLNFHEIKEGSEMNFDCQLTTGRVSLDYTKSYVLKDQFIKNKCRPE
jgi:hypothetical protein